MVWNKAYGSQDEGKVVTDGEAYCFVGEPPLGLIKSSDGISEELEGLEGRSCSIAYHFYVVGPAEACVEEKT